MQWRHTVWREPRLIYTAVPKVANTSTKSALLTAYLDPKYARRPHDARVPYETATPREIIDELGAWLHLTIVRNPFDRFVSFWAQKIDRDTGSGVTPRLERNGFRQFMPFAETANVAVTVADEDADPHFRSQAFVLWHHDRFVPNMVLRLETIEHDWELLRRLVNRPNRPELPPLPVRTTSEHDEPIAYFDDAAVATAIRERYARDFDLLGYSTDPQRTAPLRGALALTDQQVQDATGGPAGPFMEAAVGKGEDGATPFVVGIGDCDELLLAARGHGALVAPVGTSSAANKLALRPDLLPAVLPGADADVLVDPGGVVDDVDALAQFLSPRARLVTPSPPPGWTVERRDAGLGLSICRS